MKKYVPKLVNALGRVGPLWDDRVGPLSEDREEDVDDTPATDISERHQCYVSGQCQVWRFVLLAPILVVFLI